MRASPISSGFSDRDQLAVGRWPGPGKVGLCPSCAKASFKEAPYLRQPPRGHIGWFLHGGEAEAIPGGPGGLLYLSNPPEPPFLCLIGKWSQRRHFWLRATPALDRNCYPVLFVTSNRGIPATVQTVWVSARRAENLCRRLEEVGGEPWRVLRGPLPGDPEERERMLALRSEYQGRAGNESAVLIRVALSFGDATGSKQEQEDEEDEES